MFDLAACGDRAASAVTRRIGATAYDLDDA